MKDYSNTMYAGFWLRFWAYLIDICLTTAVTAAIVPSILRLLSLPVENDALTIYGVTKLIIFLLYFILMTKLTNGQTLGKMILGLRVVSINGEALSWSTVLFREGVGRYILQAIPLGILYAIIAFTPQKQGIADMFSDTCVVKEDSIQLIKELTDMPLAQQVLTESD